MVEKKSIESHEQYAIKMDATADAMLERVRHMDRKPMEKHFKENPPTPAEIAALSMWAIKIGEKEALAKNASRGGNAKNKTYQDKKKELLAVWASGKFSNRDLCAIEECDALEVSFSTARKWLLGTPHPKRKPT